MAPPAAPSHAAALGHGPLQGGAKRKALRPRPAGMGNQWEINGKSMENLGKIDWKIWKFGKLDKSMENWNNLTLSKTWGKLKETGKTIWKKSGQCGSLGGQKNCKLVDLPSEDWGLDHGYPMCTMDHHGIPCLALSQKRRRCQRPLPGIVGTSLQLQGGTERWAI